MADDLRGTGRTTKQMLGAPQGSVFVWCNDALHYPRDLARRHNRPDLTIMSPRDVEDGRLRGQWLTEVIVDHAAVLNVRQIQEIAIVSGRVECRVPVGKDFSAYGSKGL